MTTKIINVLYLFFIAITLIGCTQKETQISNEEYFFSLKNYFEKEAKRLSSKQALVLKEVKRNADSELKEIQIEDWEKEFGLFIESDINKLSWKDSYQVISHQTGLGKLDTLIYESKDPELRTREIMIIKENNEIREVVIKNQVKNYLYSSIEELKYYPDSLYEINKTQNVVLLGSNTYYISGHFR